MNNGIKFGLSNIQISTDGETYKPLAPTTQEVFVRFEEVEPIEDKYKFDFTQPIEFSERIRKKKNGTIFERCLYYRHSKKKRIRKKYDIQRILFSLGDRK